MRAMIWIVVVLTVLLAGAVVADGVLRQQTEERIATEMAAGIPGVEQPPAVSIGGFPFLTQLMAGRRRRCPRTARHARRGDGGCRPLRGRGTAGRRWCRWRAPA